MSNVRVRITAFAVDLGFADVLARLSSTLNAPPHVDKHKLVAPASPSPPPPNPTPPPPPNPPLTTAPVVKPRRKLQLSSLQQSAIAIAASADEALLNTIAKDGAESAGTDPEVSGMMDLMMESVVVASASLGVQSPPRRLPHVDVSGGSINRTVGVRRRLDLRTAPKEGGVKNALSPLRTKRKEKPSSGSSVSSQHPTHKETVSTHTSPAAKRARIIADGSTHQQSAQAQAQAATSPVRVANMQPSQAVAAAVVVPAAIPVTQYMPEDLAHLMRMVGTSASLGGGGGIAPTDTQVTLALQQHMNLPLTHQQQLMLLGSQADLLDKIIAATPPASKQRFFYDQSNHGFLHCFGAMMIHLFISGVHKHDFEANYLRRERTSLASITKYLAQTRNCLLSAKTSTRTEVLSLRNEDPSYPLLLTLLEGVPLRSAGQETTSVVRSPVMVPERALKQMAEHLAAMASMESPNDCGDALMEFKNNFFKIPATVASESLDGACLPFKLRMGNARLVSRPKLTKFGYVVRTKNNEYPVSYREDLLAPDGDPIFVEFLPHFKPAGRYSLTFVRESAMIMTPNPFIIRTIGNHRVDHSVQHVPPPRHEVVRPDEHGVYRVQVDPRTKITVSCVSQPPGLASLQGNNPFRYDNATRGQLPPIREEFCFTFQVDSSLHDTASIGASPGSSPALGPAQPGGSPLPPLGAHMGNDFAMEDQQGHLSLDELAPPRPLAGYQDPPPDISASAAAAGAANSSPRCETLMWTVEIPRFANHPMLCSSMLVMHAPRAGWWQVLLFGQLTPGQPSPFPPSSEVDPSLPSAINVVHAWRLTTFQEFNNFWLCLCDKFDASAHAHAAKYLVCSLRPITDMLCDAVPLFHAPEFRKWVHESKNDCIVLS